MGPGKSSKTKDNGTPKSLMLDVRIISSEGMERESFRISPFPERINLNLSTFISIVFFSVHWMTASRSD